MSCYHPLRAFDTGLKSKKSGKPIYKILREATTDEASFSKFYGEAKLIPCGRCIGCRLDYSRQWAMRCMLEVKMSHDCYFLTLTYDDQHLTDPSLHKKDLSKFIKDLRRYYSYHYGVDNIRFFACGEYGTSFMRKHFHIIAFNLPINDLKKYKSCNGVMLYNSKTISDIWKNGFCVIGDVTWESCAYVARYVLKKKYGIESDVYDKLCIEPEFVLMSRNPGIGGSFFEQYKDKIYSNDEIILNNGLVVKPPRYFDKLMEQYMNLDLIKEQRLAAAETNSLFSNLSCNLSNVQMRHDAEERKLQIIHTLKRSIE